MATHASPYDQDKDFWENYIKGRPQAPKEFFDQIFTYHANHGGQLGTVHDAGAGVGPYSNVLKEKFQHVIVSDITESNVTRAAERLGQDGYSYRTAKIEDASDITPGSVDMVFASNVLHFADLDATQEAIAAQLKPGGTFVCAGFGLANLQESDRDVQAAYDQLRQKGAQTLFEKAGPQMLRSFIRVQSGYSFAPMDEKYFLPGAQRININSGKGGEVWTPQIPEELRAKALSEPSRAGPNDENIEEEQDGWDFEMDLQGMKDHIASFGFVAMAREAYEPAIKEIEEVMAGGRKVKGRWPCRLMLATRR